MIEEEKEEEREEEEGRKEGRKEGAVVASKNKNPTLRMWGKKYSTGRTPHEYTRQERENLERNSSGEREFREKLVWREKM